MKKNSFKKALASIAALSVVACMAAIPANAVTAGYTDGGTVNITIDQKEIDIKDIGTPVPIYVTIKAVDKGISAIEFGTKVDERCTYTYVTDGEEAMDLAGKTLSIPMTVGDSDVKNFNWLTWASDKARTKDTTAILFMVTVPSSAKVGDKFDIKYDITSGSSPELLRNDTDMIEYKGAATDGYILITGEEESSAAESSAAESSAAESSAAESSAAESSAAESSAAESSAAESSVAESSAVESSDSTAESSDSTASSSTDSTTSSNGGSSSNTSSGSGSPKTGSSDVLPIAGAAAAVAVLGGVALVAKKKND